MVQTYSDVVTMRAGATPQTFDGAQTITLNEKARKLVGIQISESLSVRTTDEGSAKVVRLTSSNWNGSRYFLMGSAFSSGPANNNSSKGAPMDFVALDIPVAPNSTVQIDITEASGATQTGTHDVAVELMYADGNLPADVQAAMNAKAGCPAVKGGTYNYLAGATATAETALTGNAGALVNIPQEAREIVGIATSMECDTAVTADEEHAAYIRTDYGIATQGVQKQALPGIQPNDGTEVEGNIPRLVSRNPMYLGNLPGRELQVRTYLNLYGAVSGGVGIVVNYLWR